MGILSSLLGGGTGGAGQGLSGILGSLGQGLSDNSGMLLGFAGGGPEGAIQGKRSDMLAAAQRQEQEDKAKKIAAAQMMAQELKLPPALAQNPEVVSQLYSQVKGHQLVPRELSFQEKLFNSLPADQKAAAQSALLGLSKNNPDFGVIGEDGGGVKQYGFIDKANRSVSPFGASAGAPGSNPYALGGKGGSEAQTNAALFANRAAQAQDILNEKEDALTSTGEAIASSIPFISNRLVSKDRQEAEQAKTNFVTAVLRKESGASISPTEFKQAETVYFPQPGDAPEVIEQKRQARISAVQGLMGGAGPGYTAPKGWEDPKTAGRKQPKQTQAAKIGQQIGGQGAAQSAPSAIPSGAYDYVPGKGLVPRQ